MSTNRLRALTTMNFGFFTGHTFSFFQSYGAIISGLLIANLTYMIDQIALSTDEDDSDEFDLHQALKGTANNNLLFILALLAATAAIHNTLPEQNAMPIQTTLAIASLANLMATVLLSQMMDTFQNRQRFRK